MSMIKVERWALTGKILAVLVAVGLVAVLLDSFVENQVEERTEQQLNEFLAPERLNAATRTQVLLQQVYKTPATDTLGRRLVVAAYNHWIDSLRADVGVK